MKIHDFSKLVTANEALKVQVNIAQIKEILKVLNFLTDGQLYKIIKEL